MKIRRRKFEEHTGLVVSGGDKPDKKVPSVSAGIALAMDRASRAAEGTKVAVLEYGEQLGFALRRECDTIYVKGGA